LLELNRRGRRRRGRRLRSVRLQLATRLLSEATLVRRVDQRLRSGVLRVLLASF